MFYRIYIKHKDEPYWADFREIAQVYSKQDRDKLKSEYRKKGYRVRTKRAR